MFFAVTTAATDLLTPAEVARLFGVSAQTITRWTREGRLECEVTLGGHRRFRREAVEAFKAKDSA